MKTTYYVQVALALFAGACLYSVVAANAQDPAARPLPAPAGPAVTKPVQQVGFWVIGIYIHTNNEAEMKEGSAIPALWHRFMEQNVASSIPNRIGDETYVVYSDYLPDHGGSYTYLIGAKASSTTNVPLGMIVREVPTGQYVIVSSEKGPIPVVVPAVWKNIWTMGDGELGGKRALKADYEVYDVKTLDPHNAQVDVHIGVE